MAKISKHNTAHFTECDRCKQLEREVEEYRNALHNLIKLMMKTLSKQ